MNEYRRTSKQTNQWQVRWPSNGGNDTPAAALIYVIVVVDYIYIDIVYIVYNKYMYI